MLKRLGLVAIPFALLVAGCGDDDAGTTTTSTQATATTATTAAPPPTSGAPAMSPAEVVFEDQESDGSSIVVASVTLPAPGFIAVHGNADGGPGPVIGHSALLPEGTSTDVAVTLDAPLTETDLVFPMAHIDVNGNGVYEFFPPDDTVDGPAQTADGEVAVVGAQVDVAVDGEAAEAAVITIQGFDFGDPISVAVGEEITVSNQDATSHTWTSNAGLFDSGTIGGGEEFTFTFDEGGEYSFFCSIHPTMTGTITVTG